jgi:hypothetical protein
MALPMDEQRILDEIERGLANADPLLAARLSSFGFQRKTLKLRTRRARFAVSCVTVAVVAAMSLVVYALVPFRTVADRHSPGRSSASPRPSALTVPGLTVPGGSPANQTGAGGQAGPASGGHVLSTPAPSSAPAHPGVPAARSQ